jgi:hypothetical protein
MHHRNANRTPLLALLVPLLVCSGAHGQDEPATFTVRSGDCAISWQVLPSDTNRVVIQHRSDCGLPLGEQAPLIADLLGKVPAPFHTLSWGRLCPDGARDVTMPVRLALAARRSPGWDGRRGAPRSGDPSGFIKKLANDALIYRELQRVFTAAGLDLRLTAVEKVLVLRARELPFFDRLRAGGAQPSDKLPFDCQAWFSVGPASGRQ